MNSEMRASDAATKRPKFVWAILVLYTFGLLVGLASMYAIFSRAFRLPPGDAAFYASFGTINFLGLAASALLSLGVMVQLFRMRKSAASIATAGFVVLIVKEAWYQPQLMRLGHSPVPALIGVVLASLVVCYTWYLKRTGALR